MVRLFFYLSLFLIVASTTFAIPGISDRLPASNDGNINLIPEAGIRTASVYEVHWIDKMNKLVRAKFKRMLWDLEVRRIALKRKAAERRRKKPRKLLPSPRPMKQLLSPDHHKSKKPRNLLPSPRPMKQLHSPDHHKKQDHVVRDPPHSGLTERKPGDPPESYLKKPKKDPEN